MTGRKDSHLGDNMARKNQYPAKVFTETHASCGRCNSMRPFSDFGKDVNAPKELSYWCKECSSANARKNHQIRKGDLSYTNSKRNTSIKRKYGITLQEYEDKLAAQNNECAICKIKLSNSGQLTHLDHNHYTDKLRDFLCTNCNRGLGHFQDNQELLMKAAEYLERHKE